MALIIQSASVSSNSQTASSQQRRIISASVHSSLSYISLNRDTGNGEQQSSDTSVLVSKPSCCRKLIHKFEKESREHESNKAHPTQLTRRASSSVFSRLFDHRPQRHPHYDENLTFCPKINPVSEKLAQERSGKLEEIQTKAASVTANRIARIYADYTFKPVVSERSLRIAQSMGVEFLTRQEQHLQKKQKFVRQSALMNFSIV